MTRPERQQLWHNAQHAVSDATAHITASAAVDPRTAGDAAWAAADLLAAVAQITEGRRGGPVTDAARTFEHAGRQLHRRPVEPTPAGRGLRTASAGLLLTRIALPSETRQLVVLLEQFVALAEAIARLRETQHRAAQAAAARRAAEQLHGLYQPRRPTPAPATGRAAASTDVWVAGRAHQPAAPSAHRRR